MEELLTELVEENFNKIINEKMIEMIDHPEKIPIALGELLERTMDEKIQLFIDQPEKIIDDYFETVEKDLLEGAEKDIKKLNENLKKIPKTAKEFFEKNSEIIDEYAKLLVDDPEKLSRLLKEKYNGKFDEDVKLFTSNRKGVPENGWKLLKEKYIDLFNEDIRLFIDSPEELKERRLREIKEKYQYLIDKNENIQVLLNNPKNIPNAGWLLLKERYVRDINNRISKYSNDISKVPEKVWKLLKEKCNEIIDENIQIFISNPSKTIETKINSVKEKYIERSTSRIKKEINKGKNGLKELEVNYQKILNIQNHMKSELKKASNEITDKINIEIKVKCFIRKNISKLNSQSIKDSLLRNLKGKKRMY